MSEILLIILLILVTMNIVIGLFKKPKIEIQSQLKEIEAFMLKFDSTLERIEKSIKDEFQRYRVESNEISKTNREELGDALKSFEIRFTENTKELNELLRQKFGDFSKQQSDIHKQTTDNVKEIKGSVEKQLKAIREDNTKQLDEMRKTVDEKLQKTLNDRLSQSFETVSKQLQAVQEGLGEMKILATDVGGLKKILSNVKMRGSIGEFQLEMLLEQILSPDQYEANVKTVKSSSEIVEFAVKLPGRDDSGSTVWLPIDAKFPKDIYEQLLEAYEAGDQGEINIAKKNMESTIKKMAKDISDPSNTHQSIVSLPLSSNYCKRSPFFND